MLFAWYRRSFLEILKLDGCQAWFLAILHQLIAKRKQTLTFASGINPVARTAYALVDAFASRWEGFMFSSSLETTTPFMAILSLNHHAWARKI